MSISRERVVEVIAQMLSLTASEADGRYVFELPVEDRSLKLDFDRLDRMIADVGAYKCLDETAVVLGKSFEVLLRRENSVRMLRFRNRREPLVVADVQHGIEYIIGPPSDAYLVFLLLGLPEDIGPRNMRGYYPRDVVRYSELTEEAIEVLGVMLGVQSLRINSTSSIRLDRWQNYADAFFFQLGFNLDMAITQERYFAELLRPSRISRLRRTRLVDLDAPRRHYIADLVYHYQLAVSAESPMLEYLSFYHIAEHWFESIYQEDLVKKLQQQITSPNFSYKRSKDIRQVIKTVTKAVALRNEELVINEQVALKLTLERHVNLDELRDDIHAFEKGLASYYAESKVKFCEGATVDLTASDSQAVYMALAQRIYKTRNALVHSKDGSKAKFVPFSHERQLIREIPLIRFIAEQIIVATSDVLE
ncbi:hypothetical protein ACFYU5_04680 [Nocardia aobensis]|uniref:Apea-like HEPN domain-containing protein n=1 Tax=Nocardia aobensis TaxID=257277 RepID=A0ABW6NXC3_9NOCA